MAHLVTNETSIVPKARIRWWPTRVGALLISFATAALVGGCYPRYDWRDYRPDCLRAWCGFVATFPARATVATRDIPVGAGSPPPTLPLTLYVVSIDDVRFAVAAFALPPGADAAPARALLERKLLDDVGAAAGKRGTTTLRTADGERLAVATLDAAGVEGGVAMRAVARFVERRDRLVEILVVGPAARLDSDRGRQAVETFVTSLRLD